MYCSRHIKRHNIEILECVLKCAICRKWTEFKGCSKTIGGSLTANSHHHTLLYRDAQLAVELIGPTFWDETTCAATPDDGGSQRGQKGSAWLGSVVSYWIWPDWDFKQPLRQTDASLKTGDSVWRWFTAALTRTKTPRNGMERHKAA